VRLIGKVGAWLDHRLKLGATIRETVTHPVPRSSASWLYVFGSAALTVFLLQIVTGILLALVYVPSAGEITACRPITASRWDVGRALQAGVQP
jgi:ubiquinol-cytochrome c reductase cytochrome b subunit